MRENAVITYENDYKQRYEGFDPKSTESYIIFNFIQNAHLKQSMNLASLVQKHFRTSAKRKDLGVHQAGFLVIRETSMPSVLIETGFISNIAEDRITSYNVCYTKLLRSLCVNQPLIAPEQRFNRTWVSFLFFPVSFLLPF